MIFLQDFSSHFSLDILVNNQSSFVQFNEFFEILNVDCFIIKYAGTKMFDRPYNSEQFALYCRVSGVSYIEGM